jgi:hypothetical protein
LVREDGNPGKYNTEIRSINFYKGVLVKKWGFETIAA